MKILLTNDDGYTSVFLKGLYTYCVQKLLDCTFVVVAPKTNKSGVSQSISLGNKIFYEKICDSWYAVDGTPTDCILVGTSTGTDEFSDIDLVISGPNEGSNLGQDIFYSGTVGAAREAVLKDIPAIAFSISDETNNRLEDFKVERFNEFLDKWLLAFIHLAMDKKPNLININISNLKTLEVQEAKLAHRYYYNFKEHVCDEKNKNLFFAHQVQRGVDDSRALVGSDWHTSLKDKTVYTVISAWPIEEKNTFLQLQKYINKPIKLIRKI